MINLTVCKTKTYSNTLWNIKKIDSKFKYRVAQLNELLIHGRTQLKVLRQFNFADCPRALERCLEMTFQLSKCREG